MKDGEEKGDGKGFAPDEDVLAEELDSLYQKVASLDSPQMSARIREKAAPKGTDHNVPEYPHAEYGDKTQESARQASKVTSPSKRRYWILGAVLTIMVAAVVSVHFWPDLYYYETINSGNKIYPLRINKLTASASFYDGKAWVAPPAVSSPAPIAVAAGVTSPEPVKKKNEIKPNQPVKMVGGKKNGFSIQVASFKENDEALAWMASMNIKKTDVRVIKVDLQDKGIWHRILLDRFDSREEANRYLETLKLQGKYPGCFIRRDQIEERQ